MKRLSAVLIAALALPASASVSRQALVSDIQDMIDLIPSKAQDPVDVRYRAIFSDLRDLARRTPNLQGVSSTFARDKNDYLNGMFFAHHADFNDDPARFQAYVRERLDVVVTLRKIAEKKSGMRVSPEQLERVAAWRKQLDSLSVPQRQLDLISLCLGSGYMARATSRVTGGEAIVFKADYIPRQRAPEAGLSAPPTVERVSFLVPDATSLSGLIANVAGASISYARAVAQEIASSSAARAIDERLTAGLVWAESGFHAAVGSWAGCLGLGQLSEGAARAYGVRDRADIAQNLKGTTGLLGDLLRQFSTPDERSYVNGLFAQGASRVRRGVAASAVFGELWPKIPDGMKDAVASYNAGSGAVQRAGGWDKLPLPRAPHEKYSAPDPLVFLALRGRVDEAGRPLAEHCFNRPARDNSYCQTMAYVPRVFKNYFAAFVATTPDAPAIYASADGKSPRES